MTIGQKLREAANELGHAVLDGVEATRDRIRDDHERVVILEQIIADAPHDMWCDSEQLQLDDNEHPCNCWKSKVPQ